MYALLPRAVVYAPSHASLTLPASLPSLSGADILRQQGVLFWQAGQPGAALAWLARCSDAAHIDVALSPLAKAVSSGEGAAHAAALEALQPLLEALPPGSANAALLAVHRLLERGSSGGSASGGGGGRGMHAAVAALAQLPEAMRDSCLQLVCGTLPVMPPGALGEADVLWLLQWLLVGALGSPLPCSIVPRQRVRWPIRLHFVCWRFPRSLSRSALLPPVPYMRQASLTCTTARCALTTPYFPCFPSSPFGLAERRGTAAARAAGPAARRGWAGLLNPGGPPGFGPLPGGGAHAAAARHGGAWAAAAAAGRASVSVQQ